MTGFPFERRLDSTDELLQRICAKYLEMPGLRLTCRQAERFWGLDERTCREALDRLVDAGFLRRAGGDAYARLSDGAATSAAASTQSSAPLGRA